MHTRQILALLLLALASLVGLSQSVFLITLEPEGPMAEFARSYAWSSSLWHYGFGVLASLTGVFLFRQSSSCWLWSGLALAAGGTWSYVARELWTHFVVLPQLRPDFLSAHPYFPETSLWVFLPRLIWHFLFPISFAVALVAVSRRYRAPNPAA